MGVRCRVMICLGLLVAVAACGGESQLEESYPATAGSRAVGTNGDRSVGTGSASTASVAPVLGGEGLEDVMLGMHLDDLPDVWKEAVSQSMELTGCPVGTTESFDVVRVLLSDPGFTVDAITIGPDSRFDTSIGVGIGDTWETISGAFSVEPESFYLEGPGKEAASVPVMNDLGQLVYWEFAFSQAGTIDQIAVSVRQFVALGEWCG